MGGPQLFSVGGDLGVGKVALQEARAWAEAADPPSPDLARAPNRSGAQG